MVPGFASDHNVRMTATVSSAPAAAAAQLAVPGFGVRFGGRGKMMDALLGGLVVGVIANGLQLMDLTATTPPRGPGPGLPARRSG